MLFIHVFFFHSLKGYSTLTHRHSLKNDSIFLKCDRLFLKLQHWVSVKQPQNFVITQNYLTFSLLQGFPRCRLRQTFSVPALLTPFVCNFSPQEQKHSESHIISLGWTQDLFAVAELYAHGMDSPGDLPSVPTLSVPEVGAVAPSIHTVCWQ